MADNPHTKRLSAHVAARGAGMLAGCAAGALLGYATLRQIQAIERSAPGAAVATA